MKSKHFIKLVSAILLVVLCNSVRSVEQDFDDGDDMDMSVNSEEVQVSFWLA